MQVNKMMTAVKEKREILNQMQDSPEMQSFRELKLNKSALERSLRKWTIIYDAKETQQQIEVFTNNNADKKETALKQLRSSEEELMRKQEEKADLEQYAKLLEDMLTKHR